MIDVFIAYSHYDLLYKDELKKFLRPLLREERISLWDDFDIEAGQDWDARIKERLYGADLVLLLVSADSLASDYFYGKEVKVSLERHARGETIVVPVILRHCDWLETPLGGLEALPEKGRPVVEWSTRDQAFQDIVSRLRRVVESSEQRRKNATAQAEALRQFRAACEAAEHLYGKQNWREAAQAYTSALAAYKPGFIPDKVALQTQQTNCNIQIKAEQAAEVRRLKEAEVARIIAEKRTKDALAAEAQRAKEAEIARAAGEKRKKAVEALRAKEAEIARIAAEKQSRADEAADLLRAKEIETQHRRMEKERLVPEQHKNHISTPKPAINAIIRLLIFIGIGSVFVALLLLWGPWSNKSHVVPPPIMMDPVDTEMADFAAAKANGTLPVMRSFIEKKYPHEEFEKEANQLVQALESKVNTLLNDASQFPDDLNTACDLLRQAVTIEPDNAAVLKKQIEFKCKQ